MNLSLSPEAQQFIQDKVTSGTYPSAEAVIDSAIETLKQQEQLGDFAEGELDALLAIGQADIDRGDVIDGEEVFEKLARLSRERRGIKE